MFEGASPVRVGGTTLHNPHFLRAGERQKDRYGFLIDRSDDGIRPEVRIWNQEYYNTTLPSRLASWERLVQNSFT